MIDSDGKSLSAQGHDVRQSFRGAPHALEQHISDNVEVLEPAALTSEMQRFQLWATNLGLFHQDHSSLDYRLRDNEIVRCFAGELLVKLKEAFDES